MVNYDISSGSYQEFLSDIKAFIPSERIYTDELRTLGWGTDASFYRQIPKVVIRSDGEEEVSRIVKTCQKHRLPFTFRAAGTSLSGQSLSDSVPCSHPTLPASVRRWWVVLCATTHRA